MGIYTVNASIKPKFTLAIFKKDRNFFSVLSYIYIFLQILKPFSITRLVIYYFLHYYHHLHFSDSPNSTYNWHDPRKWIGSAIIAITFPYFLMDKEKYNRLDYFRLGIIEEIRFFFLDVEDPARNQKLCAKWCKKLKNKVSGLGRKRV